MLGSRQDIIGDLDRLRREILSTSNEDRSDELELLAAVAVSHGMGYHIVTKASGVPEVRIDAVLDRSPTTVKELMAGYHREPTGIIIAINR